MHIKKSLHIMVSLAVMSGVFYGGAYAHDTITTQSEVEAEINAPLANGDVTFTTTDKINQIKPTEETLIHGDEDNKHTLTLKSIQTDAPQSSSDSFYNILLQGQRLQVFDVKNLIVDTTSTKTSRSYAGNININNKGIFIVDESVENLTLKTPQSGDANIRIREGALLLGSPSIALEQGGNWGLLYLPGANAYLGDEDMRVKNIHISSTAFDAVPINQKTNVKGIEGNGSNARLTVNTDTLTIENQGSGIHLTNGAKADVGLPNHAIQQFTMNNVLHGFRIDPKTTLTVNADNIVLHYKNVPKEIPGYGILLEQGGDVTIINGTENAPGNFLIQGQIDTPDTTSNKHSGIYGRLWRDTSTNTTLRIKNGNLTIKDGTHAFFLKNELADRTANYFIDVNSLKVENIREAITNYNGNIIILAKDKIDLARQVENLGGTLSINPNGKATTIIRGYVRSQVHKSDTLKNAITKVTFQGKDSYLSGYAINTRTNKQNPGKIADTTLTFNDGATWYGNGPTTSSPYIGNGINLNLDKGRVILGNEDPIYNTSIPNEALDSSSASHKYVMLRNLNDDTPYADKGGTFVFRTNLAINDDKKIVGGLNLKTSKLKMLNDLAIIANGQSHGHHSIEVIDRSLRKPSEGLALLVQDFSKNPEATFAGEASINTGGFFLKKAIITDEVPEKYKDYADLPAQSRNWFLALIDEEVPKDPDPVVDPEPPAPDTGEPTTPPDNTGVTQPDTGTTPPDTGTATPPDTETTTPPSTPDTDTTTPTPPDTAGSNTGAQPPNIPTIQPPAITVNGQIHLDFAKSTYLLHRVMQSNLFERLGNLPSRTSHGIWAKIKHGEREQKDIHSKLTHHHLELGYQSEGKAYTKHTRYHGISYNYLDAENTFNFTRANEKVTGHVLSYAHTDVHTNGHYLDIVGKFGKLHRHLNFTGDINDSLQYRSTYYGLSTEWGREKTYANGTYIVPQIQLSYEHLGGASYHSENNIEGHINGTNSLVLRTGFIFGKRFNHANLYAKAFIHHEYHGTTSGAFYDGTHPLFAQDKNQHSWQTLGLSYEYQKDSLHKTYLDISKNFGSNTKQSWQFHFGIARNF